MPPNVAYTNFSTRGEHEVANRKPADESHENEILIRGVWYDVSSFKKRHPGGRILNWYNGMDATDAYNEFHSRSKKADKFLKALPQRPDNGKSELDCELDPITKDFHELRDQLIKEGFYEPSLTHVAYRLSEIVAMHAAGFWLVLNGWPVVGLLVLGVVQGRCGWLMHEAGHHSLTGNIKYDIPLQVILYGTGCGMSAAFWRNQHNKHHAQPQKIDHDVDLDTLPLICFNVACKDGKQKNMVNKYWVRLQAFLFTPVSCLLVAFGWQLFLHPRHSIRTGRWHEVAAYVARYSVLSWFLMYSDFATSDVLKGFTFYVWVGSAYIFTNFAVSHTHKPVIGAEDNISWVRYSSDHTANVDAGPFKWVDWWMSYLNYQIEHHLFPSMPQFRHPEVSPRVKKLFEKHGLEYDTLSYADAMIRTFSNLHNVGRDVWYG